MYDLFSVILYNSLWKTSHSHQFHYIYYLQIKVANAEVPLTGWSTASKRKFNTLSNVCTFSHSILRSPRYPILNLGLTNLYYCILDCV